MKPTFLGIGAQKCASTWLYDILADHPQICLSAQKELNFFSHFFDCGFQWYERNFECCEGKRMIGEVSPSYFHDVKVPERVHQYNPDMRLIAFLRNPVERAISNHKFLVKIGLLQGEDLSFEFGLANNPSYVEQGLYASHLERWFHYFSREHILVVLYEDIIANPSAVAKTVYEFLQIDPSHESSALYVRSNESFVYRFAWIRSSKDRVRDLFRNYGLGFVWDLVGGTGLKPLYRKINRMEPELAIPAVDSATKRELENEFHDEICRLETLIGRSLRSWREGEVDLLEEPDRSLG